MRKNALTFIEHCLDEDITRNYQQQIFGLQQVVEYNKDHVGFNGCTQKM